MFRNRRESVAGFPVRRLNLYALAPPAAYEIDAGPGDIQRHLTPEREHPENWTDFDPRLPWLLEWLAEHPGLKVLLVTATRATAESLEVCLRTRHGIRTAVFHEGMDLIQRDRAAAYFAETDDGAELLVCSEIGSEGRNFQFAHHLILFDLPFNPDLLEQRIGRLDRIGQPHDVEIHLPYFDPSPGAVLLLWYHVALNAFEAVSSVGANMLAEQEPRLLEAMSRHRDADAVDAFIEQARIETEAARQRVREGRDRLLEMNSCRPAKAVTVVNQVREAARPLELAEFMERIFDFFGVDQQTSGASSIVLHPGDHMLCHSFPGLPEGGITATFDRAEALVRDDVHYLTWEHPMVTGSLDMLLSGEFGNASICTLKAPFIKPGSLFLEAIFVIQCSGPKSLQLNRYLLESARRVVVDAAGKDLSSVLTPARIAAIANPIPPQTQRDIAKHAREPIESMARAAELALGSTLADARQAAVARLDELAGSEIERLTALAAVNDAIREVEIEFLVERREVIKNHLEAAQLRLDAVRVLLAS